jgi:hypothetical protein
MYFLRALLISLSQFVLVYGLSHLLIAFGWKLWHRHNSRSTPRSSANALFLLQVAPCVLAMLTVASLTIPSFIRFEPRVGEEELGAPIVLLSTVCLGLFTTGILRALRAMLATRRTTSGWFHEATPVVSSSGQPILESGPNTPPLVVVGLWRPTLFVSSSASGLLNDDELRLAIAHESVHIRRHDNLKKLLLRLLNIPGNSIERSWLAAVEVDADRHAVRTKHEALSLASALVKASKLKIPTAELAMNFNSEAADLLRLRVEHLLRWEDSSQEGETKMWALASLALAGMSATLVLSYPVLLVAMHEFSEILVR